MARLYCWLRSSPRGPDDDDDDRQKSLGACSPRGPLGANSTGNTVLEGDNWPGNWSVADWSVTSGEKPKFAPVCCWNALTRASSFELPPPPPLGAIGLSGAAEGWLKSNLSVLELVWSKLGRPPLGEPTPAPVTMSLVWAADSRSLLLLLLLLLAAARLPVASLVSASSSCG